MGKGREGNCRNFYGGLGKERDQDMLQVGDRNSLLLENQLLPPLTPPPNETEQKNFPPSRFKRALLPVGGLGTFLPRPPESPPSRAAHVHAGHAHAWVPPEAHVLAVRGAKTPGFPAKGSSAG